MSELTKKRVHWKEYNGEELVHDEDVDVLTSAGAVTFSDGEDLQYKYTQGQFVNPSMTGSLTNLSTTNKSSLVDAINEVKTDATSNESSIDSLTNRATTSENDIDSLEGRMTTVESDIDSVETRMTTAESDIDSVEGRMSTAESDVDSLEGRMTTAESDVDGLESDVTSLEGRMTTAESGIDSLGTRMSTAESDIDSLETRTTTAENDIDELESRITPISLGGTGATTASAAIANLHGVEITTANITYYVSPNGSDTNDGLTEDTPFKTIQHVIDILPTYIFHLITIKLADGTYPDFVSFEDFGGTGTILLEGNGSSVTNVTLSKGLQIVGCTPYMNIKWMAMNSSTSNDKGGNIGLYIDLAPSVELVALTINNSGALQTSIGIYALRSAFHTAGCNINNFIHAIRTSNTANGAIGAGAINNCTVAFVTDAHGMLQTSGVTLNNCTYEYNCSNSGLAVKSSGALIGS